MTGTGRKGVLTAVLTIVAWCAAAGAATLRTDGSTTVLPIAQRAAEEFMKKHPGTDITVRGGGSGVGITALMDGTTDIANSSRSVKASELKKAAAKGVEIRGTVVALDGIAVIVHPSNPVRELSLAQVKDIYTGRISDWSAVGGERGKIVVVSRDTASGTFEAFNELALAKSKVRPDALMQASNQAVSSVVERTPGAIGYIGLGYVTPSVKVLPIDGVVPSPATVISNKYPISRPLFMYTNGKPRGLARTFLDFVLSPEGQKLVQAAGFVPLQ